MTWQRVEAKWNGSDYSAAGLKKGEIYEIEYRITPERTIEVRVPAHPDWSQRTYATTAQYASNWKQPRRK